jgi:hypothetical protein
MFPLHLLECFLYDCFTLWRMKTLHYYLDPLISWCSTLSCPKLECICPHNVCAHIFGRLCSPIIPGVVLFGAGTNRQNFQTNGAWEVERRWALQQYCDSAPRRGILLLSSCLSKVSCIYVLYNKWRTREIADVQGKELAEIYCKHKRREDSKKLKGKEVM